MNYKKLFFLFYGLWIAVMASSLSASLNETLPTYHRAYEFIEELQVRGLCLELLQSNRPYSRGEIARCLIKSKLNLVDKKANPVVLDLFEKLRAEFSSEIYKLRRELKTDEHFNYRMYIQSNFDHDEENDIKYRGVYRSGIGLSIGKYFYAHTGVNFDQYDYSDPRYKGYKWRGFAGYAEQAYIQLKSKRFELKFGRDFLKWGFGENGTLILSDVARPLDFLLAAFRFGPCKFTYFASELDEFSSEYIESVRIPVRRFLSGHRLDLSLWGGRLQVAVAELMLYGGPDETFNVVYLNPVIFYHGEHKNSASRLGNVLPTVDFLIYPLKNLQVYSSLLIDDIQVEKTCPGDLEPNEIGWLIGSKWAEPFRLSGLTFHSEYVRITNRTYITPDALEAFIQRGKPLGHPLGNDFDHWQIGFSYWANKNIRLKFELFTTRQGEGSIYSAWDEPWMNYTVEEGYDEPFPTGVVEKSTGVNLNAAWYFRNWLRFHGQLKYIDINNLNHVKDENFGEWQGSLRAEVDLAWHWKFACNE